MGLGGCSSLAKYFLFAFNILFWLVGAALLGVGIWVLVDSSAAELFHVATASTSDTLVRGASITLIVVGVFVFFVAFFGCFGACKESACLLMTYAVIVGIILCIQIVAGILGAVFKDQIVDELGSSMNETVYLKYGQDGYNETTDSWDYMQRTFECCGALKGPEEWKGSLWLLHNAEPGETVPITCCKLTNQDRFDEVPVAINATQCYADASNTTITSSNFLNIKACEPSLEDWVVEHAAILIGVAFGLVIVQLLVILCACCMAREIRGQYKTV